MVTGGNERINAVTGHTTDSPYTAADYNGVAGSPCHHAGWIIYRHAHKPATKEAAIAQTPISNIKNIAHDAKRRSLLLDRCSEGHAVECSRFLYVHGPARIDLTSIHVKG